MAGAVERAASPTRIHVLTALPCRRNRLANNALMVFSLRAILIYRITIPSQSSPACDDNKKKEKHSNYELVAGGEG